MYFISKCCRLCLSKNNTLVNIKRKAYDKISYLSKLLQIAPALIENSRKFVIGLICEQCRRKLNKAYNFIQNCMEANAFLEKYSLQLASTNTTPNEYSNLEVPVCNLSENEIKGSIHKPIKEECISEDETEMEVTQNTFESLFIIDKFEDKLELPPVNLKIKLESNDPLINVDISSHEHDSIENVPRVSSIFLKQEFGDISANYETQKDGNFMPECNLNPEGNLPMEQIAETSGRNNTYSCSNVLIDAPDRADYCNKDTASSLTKHESIKNKRPLNKRCFKCSICNKTYPESASLRRHQKVHSGVRPFKCKICPKAFSHSGSLKEHERVHSGERPFKCKQCSKAFTQSGSLIKHERVHSGERPFKCDICNKGFTQSGGLKEHVKVHSGERPYKCEICDKAFTQSGHLTEHRKFHSGERPFKCEICDKTFTQFRSLKKHEKVHSG